jgi:N-acyl-D-amino-acid deacylase
MTYDLVIRNGTVFDGSGNQSFRADVGVIGDRIASIGRITDKGLDEIDAEGHFVTPGFVEVHTHMDAQVFWDSLGTCSAWHGITTAVMGNCGFTLAPCAEEQKDLCLRSLERAEDMARDVLLAGVDWSWETYPEYLDAVERIPKGINYAGMIGHSALRTWVMGERAFEEQATDDEILKMRQQVEAALRAGAVGFTTSRLGHHLTADDQPVASRLASWSELTQLVDVMRELGVGVFELANTISKEEGELEAYNRKLGALAVQSGRPTTFACVHALQSESWAQLSGAGGRDRSPWGSHHRSSVE